MAGIDLTQLNAGQRAVVERLDEPLFVAAGAGSGTVMAKSSASAFGSPLLENSARIASRSLKS